MICGTFVLPKTGRVWLVLYAGGHPWTRLAYTISRVLGIFLLLVYGKSSEGHPGFLASTRQGNGTASLALRTTTKMRVAPSRGAHIFMTIVVEHLNFNLIPFTFHKCLYYKIAC